MCPIINCGQNLIYRIKTKLETLTISVCVLLDYSQTGESFDVEPVDPRRILSEILRRAPIVVDTNNPGLTE